MVLKIRTIIEVAGYPQKHVNEVMLKIIENIKKEPKVKTIKEQIAEAQAAKEIFSGFMELELEIETFDKLISFCQSYLPSSIEVLDIKEIKVNTDEFRTGMNDLISYLHRVNVIVTNMQAHINQLEEQTKK